MRALQAAVVAAVVAGLLYLRLDSGAVTPEPAPPLTSLALGGLAVIFALSAWAASMSGHPRRGPLLAGLAVGVGGYAILRLLAL
jgi:hypothetical protein